MLAELPYLQIMSVNNLAALILQRTLMRYAPVKGVTRQQQGYVQMAAFDGIRGAAYGANAARTAIVGVKHPIELEAQLLRDVRRRVGTRLGRDRQAIDIFFLQAGLI